MALAADVALIRAYLAGFPVTLASSKLTFTSKTRPRKYGFIPHLSGSLTFKGLAYIVTLLKRFVYRYSNSSLNLDHDTKERFF